MPRTLATRQIQYAMRVKQYEPQADAKFLRYRLSRAKDFGFKCVLKQEDLEWIARLEPSFFSPCP